MEGYVLTSDFFALLRTANLRLADSAEVKRAESGSHVFSDDNAFAEMRTTRDLTFMGRNVNGYSALDSQPRC